MHIVIDISEKDYQLMKDGHIPFNILDAIKKGTPLPKGHGAIKDVSQIEIPMCEDRSYERWVQVAINSAPTIIEAES